MLEAEGLVRRFGGRTVLDHVGLRLDPGRSVLIRGRSGTGKTTLLNLLAGLDVPDEGRVSLAGKDLSRLDEPERAKLRLAEIGFVFQDFNLIPDLTAEENVRLPMVLAGKAGAEQRARALLDRFDLADLASAFPETLSGGEMQRVGIVRALANEPSVVLADEPTANLDEPNARRVLDTLAEVAREGRTLLVASHDPLAPLFLEEIYDLTEGRLVAAEPVAADAGDRGHA